MGDVAQLDDARRRRDQGDGDELLAPWPMVDRNPIIIGQGLTLGYISSAFRLCIIGYRQQYVDLLNELMEKDPHAYSVVSKRINTIAGGTLDIAAPEDIADEAERKLATEVAADVRARVFAIENLPEALAWLAWAVYYAVSAAEKKWTVSEEGGWTIQRFDFVHPRRLSYPDQWRWDLYIWDQGFVSGPEFGRSKTQGIFGLRIKDYPGKFVVHTPQVRGDYPTREGIGRQIAYWMAIKLIATRLAPQYLARYAIPWPDIEFNTADASGEEGGKPTPRKALDEDIAGATTAAKAMGVGGLSHYVHADAIKVNLKTPDGRPALTFPQWIALCDSQMSKAALGATETTQVTEGGSRAVADTQKEGEEKLYEFDAVQFAGMFKRDVTDELTRLNHAELPRRLYPVVKLHVNADPDPRDIIAIAKDAAIAGMPVDADAIAQKTGVPLIPNKTKTPRRMIPVKPIVVAVPPEVIGLPEVEQPETPEQKPGDNTPPADEADDDEEDNEED